MILESSDLTSWHSSSILYCQTVCIVVPWLSIRCATARAVASIVGLLLISYLLLLLLHLLVSAELAGATAHHILLMESFLRKRATHLILLLIHLMLGQLLLVARGGKIVYKCAAD